MNCMYKVYAHLSPLPGIDNDPSGSGYVWNDETPQRAFETEDEQAARTFRSQMEKRFPDVQYEVHRCVAGMALEVLK